MKRVLLKNLWYKMPDNNVIMNLISLRRMYVSDAELELMEKIEHKLNNNQALGELEDTFLRKLKREKQVLSNEIIDYYDNERKNLINKEVTGAITDLFLNLTYDCNFKCIYCYQKNFNIRNKFISLHDANLIYDFLVRYHNDKNIPLHIKKIIFSGGESLLSQNLPTIRRFIELFPNAEYKLFSNGINLIKYWKEAELDKFTDMQISLDGTDDILKKVNRYNSPAFNDIIDGILMAADKGKHVDVIAMITKETLQNVDAFVEKVEQKGLLNHSNIQLRFTVAASFKNNGQILDDIYNFEELFEIRSYLKNVVKNKRIGIDCLYDIQSLKTFLNRENNKKIDGKMMTCNYLKGLSIVFDAEGKVYWCTCTHPGEHVLGEYKPDYKINEEMMNEMLQRNIYSIKECTNCDFRYVCGSGCPIYFGKETITMLSPYCGVFKNEYFMNNLEKFI